MTIDPERSRLQPKGILTRLKTFIRKAQPNPPQVLEEETFLELSMPANSYTLIRDLALALGSSNREGVDPVAKLTQDSFRERFWMLKQAAMGRRILVVDAPLLDPILQRVQDLEGTITIIDPLIHEEKFPIVRQFFEQAKPPTPDQ